MKYRRKIESRIAAINDNSFTVQAIKNNSITTKDIQFSEIKKLSAKTSAGKVVGYTALGALAGFGVLFIVAIAALARD